MKIEIFHACNIQCLGNACVGLSVVCNPGSSANSACIIDCDNGDCPLITCTDSLDDPDYLDDLLDMYNDILSVNISELVIINDINCNKIT